MIKITRDDMGKYKYKLILDNEVILSEGGFESCGDILMFFSNVSAALNSPVSVVNLPYVCADGEESDGDRS